MAGNDSSLLALASSGPVRTYAEVAARLRAFDAELDAGDGLVWFTRWYAALIDGARRHRFVDSAFVESLECHAADRYFQALGAHLSDPGSGPSAWEPLFHARGGSRALPVQLAITGINAHVNYDLPLALVTTCAELEQAPTREAPAHGDCLRLGTLFDAVLCDTKAWLTSVPQQQVPQQQVPQQQVPQQVPHEQAPAKAQLEAVLSIWSSKRACEAAWASAEVRWALRASPSIAHHHLEALDRMVGLAGRSLLCPWQPPLPLAPPAPSRASSPGSSASPPAPSSWGRRPSSAPNR